MKIAPSILSVPDEKWDEMIRLLIRNGIEYLHLDVMDGIFVPAKTYDYRRIAGIRKQYEIAFDVHLMIDAPEKVVSEYARAGADIITFHYEATHDPQAVLASLKAANVKAGCAIKPATAVQELLPLLPFLDLVLVMSVEPGRGGQPFLEESIGKIRLLNKMRKEEDYRYLIEVDGGINREKAVLLRDAGADIIVVGSYLMNSPDIEKTLDDLKRVS